MVVDGSFFSSSSLSLSVASSANIFQVIAILHKLVLDFVYLFYPLLVLLPLTAIHVIVAVAADYSMYPIGPSPSSLFGVVVIGSIFFQPPNHREESCVALSSMHLQWYVPPLD